MLTRTVSIAASGRTTHIFNPEWSFAIVLIVGNIMAASALAVTQEGVSGMLGCYDTGWISGYGSTLLPILLCAVVAGFVVWIVEKN
jgi:hypothetical protein